MKKNTSTHLDKAGQNSCTAKIRMELQEKVYPAADTVTAALVDHALNMAEFAQLIRIIEEEAFRP